MKVLDLSKFTKVSKDTYTTPNGSILQIDTDYAMPLHPHLFKVTDRKGRQLITRSEIEAARSLK